MNEIQLAQLRDIAIEYLPAAQKARDNAKQWNRLRKYSPVQFAHIMANAALETLDDKVALPAVELAAAKLLEAVSLWQSYDPNKHKFAGIDPTQYQVNSMHGIAEAAETLATVTGRTMPHLILDDAPAAKVDAAPMPDENEPDDEKIRRDIDGAPSLNRGKNSRVKVGVWVNFQAHKLFSDGDKATDLVDKIYLEANKWGYQSDRTKEGETISKHTITKMLPPKITGGRKKNGSKSKK